MVESSAEAVWEGSLQEGQGRVKPASGSFPEQTVTWHQRSEDRSSGTSPEELLAAAHAACFSMALANGLTKAGHQPEHIETSVRVRFQAGEGITGIRIAVRGRVPGIDDAVFEQAAQEAGRNCPVSKALAATEIQVEEARLLVKA
jgi:osmotically inducible protein OsmC